MTASTQETVALLTNVPVFAPLGAEDLELVAEVCHPRRFGANEVVFREGDESNTCYVVRSGHARAVREHADGRQIALATFGPGDIFGELAMFDDEKRSATVETIEELDVLAILGPDMRRLMLGRPQLAVALAALALAPAAGHQRAARQPVLPDRPEPRGERDRPARGAVPAPRAAPDGDVPITATQADLAMLAGSSRESASRFLATLERAGVISQGRGRLTVHDPDALRNYVY